MNIRNLFRAVFVCTVLQCLVTPLLSQEAPVAPDPQIAAALQQVSAERIQETIARLVTLHTRSTLSAQDPASIASGHGIGAAREWIKSEFERYSRDCGGCLEVKTDSFTEGPANEFQLPLRLQMYTQ